MRTPVISAWLVAGLVMASSAAAVDAPATIPLRGAQCMDTNFVRGWIDENDRSLLVDTGQRKYRIEVAPACTALSYTQVIGFRGDPILGRVCGGLGEAVLTRDYPCQIKRMQILSNKEYKQALADSTGYRKARVAPGRR